jgi:phosphatidylserine decarboxylase
MDTDKLKAWPQYILPAHTLSRLVYFVTRIRIGLFKNLLISIFVRHFKVDMTEAESAKVKDYEHFNAFFTRALKPGCRPIADNPAAIISPVDATVSQFGRIQKDRIIQAKGHDYTLEALFAGDMERAGQYLYGSFITLYLSPRDYHRVHMPVAGKLKEMTYVPGRLFGVYPATVNNIPELFARNERIICHFDSAIGPVAVVMVGAINVGSMETIWHGQVTPPYGREVQQWQYPEKVSSFDRGDEIGRFNMGSTVILLTQVKQAWSNKLAPGRSVRLGQSLSVPADQS